MVKLVPKARIPLTMPEEDAERFTGEKNRTSLVEKSLKKFFHIVGNDIGLVKNLVSKIGPQDRLMYSFVKKSDYEKLIKMATVTGIHTQKLSACAVLMYLTLEKKREELQAKRDRAKRVLEKFGHRNAKKNGEHL